MYKMNQKDSNNNNQETKRNAERKGKFFISFQRLASCFPVYIINKYFTYDFDVLGLTIRNHRKRVPVIFPDQSKKRETNNTLEKKETMKRKERKDTQKSKTLRIPKTTGGNFWDPIVFD